MLSPTPLHTGAEPDQSIPQGSRISLPDWRTESPRLTPSPFRSLQATIQAVRAPVFTSQDVTPEYQSMIKGMVADAVRDLLSGNGASVTSELGNKWSLPDNTRYSQSHLVTDLIDHQLANRLIVRGDFASPDNHNASPSPSLHLSPSYPSNSKHHYDFSELPASPTSSYSTTGGYNAGIIDMGPHPTRPRIDGQSDDLYTPRSMLSMLPYSMTDSNERPGTSSAWKHMPTSHPNELHAQENPSTLSGSCHTFIDQDEEVSERMRALGVTFDASTSSTLAARMVSPFRSGSSTSYHLGSPTPVNPPGHRELVNEFLRSTAAINPPPQCFRPMSAVLEAKVNPQARPFPQDGIGSQGMPSRFSKRYLGKHTEKNASQDHLEDHENCSLWLRNLPANITYAELLDTISGFGRVWATYINRADARHETAAAKVIFFNPEAAANYLEHIESTNLQIRGLPVAVEYNRVKIPRQLSGGPQASRVLIITGHSDFVNKESLTRFFDDLIQFHTDRVIERFRVGTRAVIEFRFGSYRAQSQSAKLALEKNQPSGLECVRYGQDPCEVGEAAFSYEPGSE